VGPGGGRLYGGVIVAGVYSAILLVLPLTVMLCGWLLGPRHGWLMFASVALTLGFMAWAQMQGQLPPPILRSPFVVALCYVTLSLVALIFGLAMTDSVRQQYAKALALSREP
jgi:hypothetical protein